MKCPACDHENSEAQTFCSACGAKNDAPQAESTPAGWHCIKCGFRSENTAKFCGSCGTAHPASAPITVPDQITPTKDSLVSIASLTLILLAAIIFGLTVSDIIPNTLSETAMATAFILPPLSLALGIWGLCQRTSLKRFAILGVVLSSGCILAFLYMLDEML